MSDGTVKLSLGEMIGTASRIFRENVLVLLAYVALLGVMGAGFDMLPSGGTLLGNIANFVAGYFLYEHLLRSEGLMAEGRLGRSWGSYLLVGILTGLATLLGLVLLIVPGLILMARWSIASAIVVAEGRSATEAMGASWAETRASQWSIVLLHLIFGLAIVVPAIVLGMGLGFAGAFSPGALDAVGSFGAGLAANLFAQILSAGGFVLGVTIMRGVHSGTGELEAVFA